MVAKSNLILTITRQCNLRCSYCPTAKDGWPTLSKESTERAIDLFIQLFGEGNIKLFGGEPLLEPDLVRHVLTYAADKPQIKSVYVSTNGLGLTKDWIAFFQSYPKAIVTISMDGRPEDHNRFRRALPGVKDSYEHVRSLLPDLHRIPRLVVTQTIAPATANRAFDNFQHLRSLGFKRFNFLPGYFIPWRASQLENLGRNFQFIQDEIERSWASNQYIYVRNLFVRAPTPFFNQGLIVDSDQSIHPSNVGLSASLDHLRQETVVGTLQEPPSIEELKEKGRQVNEIIQRAVSPKIWNSTLAADRALTHFCQGLMPAFVAYKKNKGAA